MASIGSVFVDFIARTAGFQEGCKQASASLQQTAGEMGKTSAAAQASSAQMTKSFEKGFLMIAVGAHAFRLVREEIKDVIKNIDDIPGISYETIASVHRMKYALEEANGGIKGYIATFTGWVATAAQMAGAAVGGMVYGLDAMRDGWAKLNTAAEDYANKDFNKKFDELETRMNRLKMTSGELAVALEQDAQKLDATAQDGATPKERQDAALEAAKLRIQAQETLNGLQKTYRDAMEKDAITEEKITVATMSHAAAVDYLRAKKSELQRAQMALVGDNFTNFFDFDPVALEKFNEAEKKIVATNEELAKALAKVKAPAIEMRDTFVHAFDGLSDTIGKFVTSGQLKLGDFFRSTVEQVTSMYIKLALINPILNSVFGLTGTKSELTAFSLFGGARASGGDVTGGKSYMVGEVGPEMFVPNSAGTIIPNSALSSGGGGDIHVHQYNTFGSGVTAQQLAAAIPGIVKMTKDAVADAVMRGGGYKKAFAS